MKTSIRLYLGTILGLLFSIPVMAQEEGQQPEGEPLVKETFELTETYKPTLKDAIKWTFAPDLAPLPKESSKPDYYFPARKMSLPFVAANIPAVKVRSFPQKQVPFGQLGIEAGLRSLPNVTFNFQNGRQLRRVETQNNWGISAGFWNSGNVNISSYRREQTADASVWYQYFAKKGLSVSPTISFDNSTRFNFGIDSLGSDEPNLDSLKRSRNAVSFSFAIENVNDNRLWDVYFNPNLTYTSFGEYSELGLSPELLTAYVLNDELRIGIQGEFAFRNVTSELLPETYSNYAFAVGPYAGYKGKTYEINGALRFGTLDKFELFPYANMILQTNEGKMKLKVFLESFLDNNALFTLSNDNPYQRTTYNYALSKVFEAGGEISVKPIANWHLGAGVDFKRHEKLISWSPVTTNSMVYFDARVDSNVNHFEFNVFSGYSFGERFDWNAEMQLHTYDLEEGKALNLPKFNFKSDLKFEVIQDKWSILGAGEFRSGILGNIADDGTYNSLNPAIFLDASTEVNIKKITVGAGVDNILNTVAPRYFGFPGLGINPKLTLRIAL